jgi:hypothetical protein
MKMPRKPRSDRGVELNQPRKKSPIMPKRWHNLNRIDPVKYCETIWNGLTIEQQTAEKKKDRSPKPHKFLALCYPQRFPSGSSETWYLLAADGKIAI